MVDPLLRLVLVLPGPAIVAWWLGPRVRWVPPIAGAAAGLTYFGATALSVARIEVAVALVAIVGVGLFAWAPSRTFGAGFAIAYAAPWAWAATNSIA